MLAKVQCLRKVQFYFALARTARLLVVCGVSSRFAALRGGGFQDGARRRRDWQVGLPAVRRHSGAAAVAALRVVTQLPHAGCDQLERERQQTLKTIVTSGADKAKQSEERRVALKKSLASLSALVLDDSTLVVTSVEEAHAAPAGTAVRLELAYRSLRTLPPEACASNLTELSLVGNDLESLPDALSRCCKLRSLALLRLLGSLRDLLSVALATPVPQSPAAAQATSADGDTQAS